MRKGTTFIEGSDMSPVDNRRDHRAPRYSPFDPGPWTPLPLEGRKLVCIDLFSGLGGFSAAMREDPRWEVVTVELMEEFKPTVCADIMGLDHVALPHKPDLLVASPPCVAFSHMGHWKYWEGDVPTADGVLLIGLVAKTFWLIRKLNPVFWVVENPKARLRKVIGVPNTTQWWGAWGAPWAKPTDLWGRFPVSMRFRGRPPPGAVSLTMGKTDHDNAAVRSLVPLEFSRELKRAVEADYGLPPSDGDVYKGTAP